MADPDDRRTYVQDQKISPDIVHEIEAEEEKVEKALKHLRVQKGKFEGLIAKIETRLTKEPNLPDADRKGLEELAQILRDWVKPIDQALIAMDVFNDLKKEEASN